MLIASTLGPSLPPRVNGEVIGTLTIRLEKCSVADTFARVQFWGAQTFSDLRLGKNEPASEEENRSLAVEYPLVGSSFALHQYLKDATPLHVRFFRHKKCPRPSKEGSNDAVMQPELIGCASIPDVCIDELLNLKSAQDGSLKTTKLSLRRESQVFAPDPSSSNILIGEAVFELLYQFIRPSEIKSHPPTDSTSQGVTRFQSIITNQMVDLPVNRGRSQPPRTQKSYTHSAQPQFYNSDSTQSIIDDTIEIQSDLGTLGAEEEEQKSLLEELLDICTDDMTIPTIDSVNTEIDPYDLWISRIVANASSPPAKEFPSLVSAGSRHSDALRKVGLLKLEIYDVTLFSTAACKIRGKNDFYLQYCQPPKTFASVEPPSGLVEFMVREQFGARAKTQSARSETSTASRDKGAKERNVPLLASNHVNQMEITFEDDDSVRQWLDGVMKFSLLYRASKPASHLKLPRVAMLSGKCKEATSTVPGKVCIAQSCLRLCDVILSKTFSSNVKVDLVSAKNDDTVLQGIGGAGTKVGSLSVRLGLHCDNKDADQSILCSPTVPTDAEWAKMNEKKHYLLRRLQSSSPPKPHPISVLLNNFAWASNKNVGATTSNAKCTSSSPTLAHQHSEIPQQDVHFYNARDKNMKAPLKPVRAPPVWLDIRVGCVSNLSLPAAHNSVRPSSLQLCMSCNEPILLPENKLTNSHSDSISLNKSISRSELCSQKVVTVRVANSSHVSLSRDICSWHVALEADSDSESDKDRSLTLGIWHCRDGDDASCDRGKKTLIGLATIPFVLEPTNGAKQNICDWLPSVATNGWFNVLDPKSHDAPVGKVHVMVAAGMLRQIRGFPSVCKKVVAVQRWWRKSRSNKKNSPKEETVDSDNLAEEKSPKENDPDFDTDDFIGKATMEQTGDLASSPDSLFEEWSQQSMPMTRVRNSNTRLCKGTVIVAQPAVDQINQKNHALEAPPRVGLVDEELTQASDINNNTGRISTSSEGESEIVDSFECNDICTTNCKAANVEGPTSELTATCEKSGNEQSTSSIPKCCDQLEILICLEKTNGLKEIVSLWSMQQGNSDIKSLLSVSGFFVSCSLWDEETTTSNHEELHKLCVGDTVRHSKLIPADKTTLDVALNLETTISIPNHETNTELILTQMLEFKLWFVPIITTNIATMINCGQTKDMQILNGCKVISIAKCPLYHLYTLKGYYKGRLPWNMAVHEDKKNDKFIGYILASISRANLQNSPLQLSSEGNVLSNTSENHAMSTLKPMNLEASFSRGQDDFMQHKKGLDPPEERRESYKSSSSKRKIEQSSISLREFKRYRCVKSPMPRTGRPLHPEISHENHASNAQDTGEETDTICPSDTGFDWDHDSETDGAQTYRSLTSVMESLENIDSKLQQVGSFREGACDGLDASTRAEKESNVADGDPKGFRPFNAPENKDTTSCPSSCQNYERPDSPHHQMEPPEETLVPETPTHEIAPPRINNADNVKTCEKGNSPMSMARVYSDAATSPCGESLVDDKIEDQMEPNHGLAHEEDAVEKYGASKDTRTNNADNDPKCSSSKKRMRLDLDNRKRGGNSESLEYVQDYFANNRGRLDEFSKRYSSLSRESSHSLGILRSNRRRNTSILSPVLNLLSPSRLGIRAKRAGSIGKLDFRKDNSPKDDSHKRRAESILAEKKNKRGSLGFMSNDKDRLERIFRS